MLINPRDSKSPTRTEIQKLVTKADLMRRAGELAVTDAKWDRDGSERAAREFQAAADALYLAALKYQRALPF